MMHIIPDIILRAVCWTLLHSLWQGLIVAMVAGVIMVLTKKSSSSLRYNLLCGLLFFFLAVSGYTFYRQMPSAPAPTGSIAAVSVASQQLTPAKNAIIPAAGVVVQNGIERFIQYFNDHASLVVLVWFIIFLGRFVQLLSGLVYAQRIRHYQTSEASKEWRQRLVELLNKVQIKRPVLLLESALIKVPVVVGFFKPAILVPVGMLMHIAPDQVESILLHELAHIRRQDYILNLVQNLVDTLFFFNPAMIWISSLIRTERENCCDDIAIRETRSRRRLVEALVSFHEYEQSVAGYALSFAAKENQVVRRVKRIVHKKNHSLNAGERVLLATGLLILCAAFVTINNGSSNAPKKIPHASVVVASTSASVPPTTAKQPEPTQRPGTGSSMIKPTQELMQTPAQEQTQARELAQTPAQELTRTKALTPVQDTTPKKQASADLFQNASVDKIIEAKEHGVTVEYITELQQMGYKLSLDKAIELVDHGVTVEFIRAINKMGYSDLSLDKAVQLVDHGVNTEFLLGLHDLGFSNIKLDKAIFLKDRGVSPEYILEMKKRFGKLFELDDYVKLMDAGIRASSI